MNIKIKLPDPFEAFIVLFCSLYFVVITSFLWSLR
jgi:hypothetical protein